MIKLELLNESNINRLLKHMNKYDTGIITAFKGNFSKATNLKRNKELLSYLLTWGYKVIEITGAYIENYKSENPEQPPEEVKEESYFVMDVRKEKRLSSDLQYLGKIYDQDSILFIPENKNMGIIIGTSKNKNSFPGYKVMKSFPTLKLGKTNEFMSKVKGRPFFFESLSEVISSPDSMLGKMAMSKFVDKKVLANRETLLQENVISV
jgi:hypothetical protein